MRTITVLILIVLVACASFVQAGDVKVDGFAQGLYSINSHSTVNQFGLQQAYVRLSGDNFFVWLNLTGGGDKLLSQYVWYTKIRPFHLLSVSIPGSKLSVGKFKPPSGRNFLIGPTDQPTVYSSWGQGLIFYSRDLGVMWSFEDPKDSTMTMKIAITNGEDASSSPYGKDSNNAKDMFVRTTVRPINQVELGLSGRYGQGKDRLNRVIGGDIFFKFPSWTFTVESFWSDQKEKAVTGYALLTVEPIKSFQTVAVIEKFSNRTTGNDVWYSTLGVSYAWPAKGTRLAANYIDRSGDTCEPSTFVVQLQKSF